MQARVRQLHGRQAISSRLFDGCNYLLCSLIAIAALYPFLYMFALSTSDYIQISYGNVRAFPIGFHIRSYQNVLRNTIILRAYWNSILYTTTYSMLVIVLSSVAGYVLADRRFRLHGVVTVLLLVMMFFEGGMIPTFLWVRQLGLLDSIWALVLPTAVVPFYIFLFRVYIKENVPDELKESVHLDGGNELVVYSRIVLPLIKPIIATIGLFAAVSMWNEFFRPLIYLNDLKKQPLTLILRRFVVLSDFGGDLQNFTDENFYTEAAREVTDYGLFTFGFLKSIKMAMTMITVIPILLIYPFAQRYFVRGILIGSLRG